MSWFGPHPKIGPVTPCGHCAAPVQGPPSRPRKFCSRACYLSARPVNPCIGCEVAARVKGQSYCKPCGLSKNAEWRQANRPPKVGVALANVRVFKTDEQRRLEKNAAARAYRKANREKVLMWNRLRHHRLRAAGVMPDSDDIGWLMCHQGARCTYCRILFAPGVAYELDHKTPVSRGGANDLENIQLLCPTCNMKKSRKTDAEYRYRLREIDLLRMTMEALHK